MSDSELRRKLLAPRIAVVGTAVYVVGCVVLAIALPRIELPGWTLTTEVVSWMALVFLAAGSMNALDRALSQIVRDAQRRQKEEPSGEVPAGELARSYRDCVLITCGVTGGVCGFAWLFVLFSGRWVALLVPVLGLVFLALVYPTPRKFDRFSANLRGQNSG